MHCQRTVGGRSSRARLAAQVAAAARRRAPPRPDTGRADPAVEGTDPARREVDPTAVHRK